MSLRPLETLRESASSTAGLPHCSPRFTTPTRHQPAYHRTACLHLRSFCSCDHILSMSPIALGEVHEVHDVDDPHDGPHPLAQKTFPTTAKWPGTPSGRAFGPTLRQKRMRPTQQISHISYIDTYVCWGNEWGLASCGGAVGVTGGCVSCTL